MGLSYLLKDMRSGRRRGSWLSHQDFLYPLRVRIHLGLDFNDLIKIKDDLHLKERRNHLDSPEDLGTRAGPSGKGSTPTMRTIRHKVSFRLLKDCSEATLGRHPEESCQSKQYTSGTSPASWPTHGLLVVPAGRGRPSADRDRSRPRAFLAFPVWMTGRNRGCSSFVLDGVYD